MTIVCVDTVYEQGHQGKTRKYYHVTKEGLKLLERKVEEWNVYADAVSNVLAMGV